MSGADNAAAILIVDDSPSMREMVQFTLESAGYEVAAASDGVEALAQAKSTQFSMMQQTMIFISKILQVPKLMFLVLPMVLVLLELQTISHQLVLLGIRA